MKLATIDGSDGKPISLGTGLNARGERILIASNGDDVHPSPRPYCRGAIGTARAVADIWAMWGRAGGWNLQFTVAAETAPEVDENSDDGYVTAE